MTEQVRATPELREKVLSDPELILEDRDLMRALLEANDRTLGGNVVDLRGIAMRRLETRLERLEDTHQSVIAAAYENLAGTNVIHSAVLRLLEPSDFRGFLLQLSGAVPDALRINRIRLLIETSDEDPGQTAFDGVLSLVPVGVVDNYITLGRDTAIRSTTLRQVSPASREIYDDHAAYIKSECLLKLDLGEGRLPGLLVLGSEDPHQFRPNQGTDLLTFFGEAFERILRRWMA